MAGGIVQVTLNPAALQADGAYVEESIVSSSLPTAPNTSKVVLPGAANWGLVGVVQQFSDYDSGVLLYGDTQISESSAGVDYGIMARVAIMEVAASSFAAARVTDGTDEPAAGLINDTTTPTPVSLFALTAICTGSFGNRIGFLVQLQSGTISGYQGAGSTSYPVFRITISPPAGNNEIFSNIIGYTTGGAFNAPIFIANAIAAINGTHNTPPSKWVVASTVGSPGTHVPNLPLLPVALAGGTDGTTGLTDPSIIGIQGPVGTRSGMYLFNNQIPGGIIMLPGVGGVSGSPNYTSFAALAAFCAAQPCRGIWGNFTIGTDTAAAVAAITAFGLQAQRIMTFGDWTEEVDPATGLTRWLEPAAAGAAAMASATALSPDAYVGNKPRRGMSNILATENSITGIPYDIDEAGEREAVGLNWFARGGTSGGSGPFKAFHGMMSDGITLSSDVSAADYICLVVQQILNSVVGDMQGDSVNDLTRATARARVNEFMATLAGAIVDYTDTLDTTINTPATVAAGQLLCQLDVQTSGAVRFAIAAAYVGVGVQITTGASSTPLVPV